MVDTGKLNPYGGFPSREDISRNVGAITNPYGTLTPQAPLTSTAPIAIPRGTGVNPYQITQRPAVVVPPSSGAVGDFLREITTFRGTSPQQLGVPTAPTLNPYGTLPGPEAYKNLPVAPAITPTAARQVNGQTIAPITSVVKQPALINFLSPANRQQINKQNLDYTNPEARVAAPRGYTVPTPEDLATSKAVSEAYWAPYRRAATIQNENLGIKRLEAQAKLQAAQPKAPTLRDQLYGQALDASKALYELDAAAASNAPEAEREKLRQVARRKYLQGIIDLAQPKAAEAGILRGE